MPKAKCPACNAEVKYAKDAEPGSTVTCPDCDEVFTPPALKAKPAKAPKATYSAEEDEDTYEVKRSRPNQADRDKAEQAERAIRAGRRRERELDEMARGPQRPAWFKGPEIWLLIFAVGAGTGLPFGIWLALNWEKMSDVKVFWLFVLLLAVGAAALGLSGSVWAWLRRN